MEQTEELIKMGLTKEEKKMTISVLLICLGLLITTTLMVTFIDRKIEEAGGVKEIIITVGKDLKDIKRKIEDH